MMAGNNMEEDEFQQALIIRQVDGGISNEGLEIIRQLRNNQPTNNNEYISKPTKN